MRPLVLLPAFALVALWATALLLWPELPERIPLHFDATGTPDRYGARTAANWFLLPGLGTGLVLLFAFALPPWVTHLARSNASTLSVPRRADFGRLAPEARVRAIQPVCTMLIVLATEMTALFGMLLVGTARVASGAWKVLPTAMVFGAVGLLLATGVLWIPVLNGAVRRELERAALP